jgi:hypothetical protein
MRCTLTISLLLLGFSDAGETMVFLGRSLPITYLASLAIQVAVVIAVVVIVVLLTRQGRRDTNGQTETALSDIRESVAASRDETAKALSGLERQMAARIEQLSNVLSERLRQDLARQDQQQKTELLAELPAQSQRDITRLEQRMNELRSATTSGLTTNLDRLRTELGAAIRRSQDTLGTAMQVIAARLDRIERALAETARTDRPPGNHVNPAVTTTAVKPPQHGDSDDLHILTALREQSLAVQSLNDRLRRIEESIGKTQVPNPKPQPSPKEPSSNSVD